MQKACWPSIQPSRQQRSTARRPSDRNSYDYRVVLARRLYDRATGTSKSPSLAGLAGGSDARVNPADADKISAPEDGTMNLIGARGSVRLALVRDSAVPRGTVLIPFNRGSEINSIIDATAGATDVRIEGGPTESPSDASERVGPT